MPADFDPYFEWLGIAPKHQPPNHYRLLNLDLLEDDEALIAAAAQRVTARLREVESGKHDAVTRRLLKEVMAAGSCLLDEDTKSKYDKKLQAGEKAKSSDPAKDHATVEDQATVEEDEFKLAPLQEEPKVRQVQRSSATMDFDPLNPEAAEPPLGILSSSGTHSTRSATSVARRARSKQDPVVLTLLLVLLLVVCGVTLYVVFIAPPGTGEPAVAGNDATDHSDVESKPKQHKSARTPTLKPKNSRNRNTTLRPSAKHNGNGPKLDSIDAVVAMPLVKPLPFALALEEETSGPIEGPLVDDPVVNDIAPEDREAAEKIWDKGRAAGRRGDIDTAIPLLEKYILQQKSDKHHAEAEQLLAEVRAAVPDEHLIARVFQSLSDEQLDQLANERLSIRIDVEFTNPVLDDIFHKTLRDQVPAEKLRRSGKAKKPAE